jgi:hypothetical protein
MTKKKKKKKKKELFTCVLKWYTYRCLNVLDFILCTFET